MISTGGHGLEHQNSRKCHEGWNDWEPAKDLEEDLTFSAHNHGSGNVANIGGTHFPLPLWEEEYINKVVKQYISVGYPNSQTVKYSLKWGGCCVPFLYQSLNHWSTLCYENTLKFGIQESTKTREPVKRLNFIRFNYCLTWTMAAFLSISKKTRWVFILNLGENDETNLTCAYFSDGLGFFTTT